MGKPIQIPPILKISDTGHDMYNKSFPKNSNSKWHFVQLAHLFQLLTIKIVKFSVVPNML